MFDNLKEHIDRNRDDFEIHELDMAGSWAEISTKLEKRKSGGRRIWMKIAAVILVFVTSVVVFKTAGVDGNYKSSELIEAQAYYQGMIDTQMKVVNSRVDDPEVLADLEALDRAFAELSGDLKDDVHNEEVVAAMIENYRLKLKILERILEDLEYEGNEENIGI